MLYILGVISGIYFTIGFINSILYLTKLGFMGHADTVDFFKHWFLWPVYRYYN